MSCAPVRRPRAACSTLRAQRQVSAVTASPSPRGNGNEGFGVALCATPRPLSGLEQLVKLGNLVNLEDLEELEDLVDPP